MQQDAKASNDADPFLVGSAQWDMFRTSSSRQRTWCIEGAGWRSTMGINWGAIDSIDHRWVPFEIIEGASYDNLISAVHCTRTGGQPTLHHQLRRKCLFYGPSRKGTRGAESVPSGTWNSEGIENLSKGRTSGKLRICFREIRCAWNGRSTVQVDQSVPSVDGRFQTRGSS